MQTGATGALVWFEATKVSKEHGVHQKQTTSSHNHNSNTVSEVPHEERILLIVRSAQCPVYHQNLSPHKSSH